MSENAEQHTVYVDHTVMDENDHELGKVTDVVYGPSADHPEDDDAERTPTWLVVDPGLLRASHFVPVANSYRSESGNIIVPWNADWIKKAPKAGSDHVVTDELRAELNEHYGSPRTSD